MRLDNSFALISRVRESTNKFLLNELEDLGLRDLAPSHGDVFAALFIHGELTMTEIADQINRDRSTVTTLVNKLTQLGFVSSKKNEKDGRSNIIFLTAKGRKLEDGFKRISGKLFNKAYHGITLEEREVFLTILRKICENLK
ncbi:MAG: MarR family winged helix-turn-helix transcriptional regulator [Peptococcales bacterium]